MKMNFIIKCKGQQVKTNNENLIAQYFETVDWLKSKILEVKDNPKEVEKYQAHLGEYEMNLENIVIERG
jgi:hypothetical protein